ncbi:MAG: hypothetical protein P4L45_09935, partial [Ignavibacteriaceae bacterium]|nr:hypothetical protein [Ignavibacteriaceae bacterium]
FNRYIHKYIIFSNEIFSILSVFNVYTQVINSHTEADILTYIFRHYTGRLHGKVRINSQMIFSLLFTPGYYFLGV